jgi:hypothetical protein
MEMSWEEARARGIDTDLMGCLGDNPQSFTIDEILKVHAVIEGENAAKNWHWLVTLTQGRFAYITGGCDYTGWG